MADETTGEGTKTVEGDEKTGGDGEPKFVAGKDGVETVSLTQDQLNTMMADNRRKLTTANSTMAEQLEQLQGRVKMSDGEREQLTNTVETLRTQTLTEKELAKREATKKDAQHQTTVTSLTKERDDWKSRYTGAEIKRAIVDGANHEDVEAFDASQMVDLLVGKTSLVSNEDGSQKVVVALQSKNEEGEAVELALDPVEAMKAMKGEARFANLFVKKGSAGLGETGNVGAGKGAPDMANMAEYMAWRKDNPDLKV